MIEWIEDGAPDNGVVLAAAAREVAGLRRWMWLCACLLPTGLLIPVALLLPAGDLWIALLCIGAVVLMVSSLCLAILAGSVSTAAGRLARLEEADRLGYRVVVENDRKRVAGLRRFRLLNEATKLTSRTRFEGSVSGIRCEVYEAELTWVWATGEGLLESDTASGVSQSLVLLPGAVEGVAALRATPKGWMKRTGGGVEVSGEPAFNKAYTLASREGEEAARHLSPALAGLCVGDGRLAFEVHGADLLVYWPGELIPAGKLEERLGTAYEIARLLRAAAR